MSVRFGVSPIAWINDDLPALGGNTPLESVLADARDIGFCGIELGGVFPRDPYILGPLLRRYQLLLAGGWYSASLLSRSAEEEIVALQPHLALLKAMGCGVFIIAETSNAIHTDQTCPLSATPRLPDSDWKSFGLKLTIVADYLQEAGLRLAYHHHLGTVVQGQQDVDRLLESTGPSVGLTLDTGHAALGGIDTPALIGAHPTRIAHVHCKDVRSGVFKRVQAADGSFLSGVVDGMFTVPSDGGVDFSRVLRELARIGYSGWIIIEAEQDPAIADPKRFAETGLKALRREASGANLHEARKS